MKRYNKTRKIKAKVRGGERIGLMNPIYGGGGCGCRSVPPIPTPLTGGYTPTPRDLKYLRKWKQGKSIGFTIRSSLKAKGLIPRANGTKKVSPKYRK
jgi:hypothetical protein